MAPRFLLLDGTHVCCSYSNSSENFTAHTPSASAPIHVHQQQQLCAIPIHAIPDILRQSHSFHAMHNINKSDVVVVQESLRLKTDECNVLFSDSGDNYGRRIIYRDEADGAVLISSPSRKTKYVRVKNVQSVIIADFMGDGSDTVLMLPDICNVSIASEIQNQQRDDAGTFLEYILSHSILTDGNIIIHGMAYEGDNFLSSENNAVCLNMKQVTTDKVNASNNFTKNDDEPCVLDGNTDEVMEYETAKVCDRHLLEGKVDALKSLAKSLQSRLTLEHELTLRKWQVHMAKLSAVRQAHDLIYEQIRCDTRLQEIKKKQHPQQTPFIPVFRTKSSNDNDEVNQTNEQCRISFNTKFPFELVRVTWSTRLQAIDIEVDILAHERMLNVDHENNIPDKASSITTQYRNLFLSCSISLPNKGDIRTRSGIVPHLLPGECATIIAEVYAPDGFVHSDNEEIVLGIDVHWNEYGNCREGIDPIRHMQHTMEIYEKLSRQGLTVGKIKLSPESMLFQCKRQSASFAVPGASSSSMACFGHIKPRNITVSSRHFATSHGKSDGCVQTLLSSLSRDECIIDQIQWEGNEISVFGDTPEVRAALFQVFLKCLPDDTILSHTSEKSRTIQILLSAILAELNLMKRHSDMMPAVLSTEILNEMARFQIATDRSAAASLTSF